MRTLTTNADKGDFTRFDCGNSAFMACPQFLRETNYVNPTDPNMCPWQLGQHTALTTFAWLQEHPKIIEHFLLWMANQRDGLPTFFDVVDFRQELGQNADNTTILFVDVGGAMGHQCIALRKKYPGLVGRVILQDQARLLEQVKANPLSGFEGIETQVYDFFTPQPVKGTALKTTGSSYLYNKFYYRCSGVLSA